MLPDKTTHDRNTMHLNEEPGTLASFTQLNEVMQVLLKPLQVAGRRSTIAVRCAELPQVQGHSQVWTALFEALLQTIVQHPPSGKQLFLHIDCEKVEASSAFGDVPKRLAYQLQFHTNVQPSESWQKATQATLEDCRNRFANLRAGLSVHTLVGSSCLYTIHIPVQP